MKRHASHGQPRYKQVILAGSIAILLVAFVMYGISVVYESPKYDFYCNSSVIESKVHDTKQTCEADGGAWQQDLGPKCINCPPSPPAYCDIYHTCSQQFNDVNQKYERTVFFLG